MTNTALKKEDDFVSIDPNTVIRASEVDKIHVQGGTVLNGNIPIIESMPCIKKTSKTCSWSKFALLFIVCFILPTDGMSKTNDKGQKSLPKDVQTFLKNYDLCYYFLGEEPYNEKRRVYLSQQVEKYCPDIKSNLIHLKSKYKSNKEVSKTLDAYDESVE